MAVFQNLYQIVFNNFSPYLYISPQNAVYLDGMRRQHARLRQQRTRNWCIGLAGCVVFIWLILTVLMLVDTRNTGEIYRLLTTLLSYMALATLADKLIVDFGVVNAGLTVISDDLHSGRWELIAISPLSTFDYVRGKVAAQQWISWRLVALSMTFRVTVLACIFLHIFVIPAFLPAETFNSSTPLTHLLRRMSANPPESVFIYVIYGVSVFIAAVVYCIEPRWRLRVLTASAIALSAKGQNTTINLLSGLLIIARVWISQMLFAITGIVMLLMIVWISMLMYWFTLSDVLVIFSVPVYVYLLSAYVRSAYEGLYERSIKRAYKRLVQHGGTP